ncbi:hypothetical protein EU537_12385 [Candidatus Thorarchaeota archaeon]|nr:MAG: hypothetical protein EU537_12385 [Candidatus Thorarchaeota archaeon]
MDGYVTKSRELYYLRLLHENPPVSPYVSRGTKQDLIDIAEPHVHVDKELLRLASLVIDRGESRFLPIVGGTGMGKTHLYWAIKSLGKRHTSTPYRCVYVPPPSSPSRIGIQVYTPFVEEMGSSHFVFCVKHAFAKAGLRGIKSLHLNYAEHLTRLKNAFPRYSGDLLAVVARYGTDSKLRPIALRWLLGHHLHAKEREKLQVDKCLDDDRTALDTLCLLIESSPVPIVFYFDEMESPFRTLDENGQEQFLSFIRLLSKKSQNAIIICACLDEIWKSIESTIIPSEDNISVEPVELIPFTVDHLREYVGSFMSAYWMNQGVDIPEDEIYPFSDNDIKTIFQISNGNPRNIIRIVHEVLEFKLIRT